MLTRKRGDVIDKDCTCVSRLGWQKDSRFMEGLWGMLNYTINYALYLAHYDAYFHINDDAKKCKYLSVTNDLIFPHNSFKLLSREVL